MEREKHTKCKQDVSRLIKKVEKGRHRKARWKGQWSKVQVSIKDHDPQMNIQFKRTLFLTYPPTQSLPHSWTKPKLRGRSIEPTYLFCRTGFIHHHWLLHGPPLNFRVRSPECVWFSDWQHFDRVTSSINKLEISCGLLSFVLITQLGLKAVCFSSPQDSHEPFRNITTTVPSFWIIELWKTYLREHLVARANYFNKMRILNVRDISR